MKQKVEKSEKDNAILSSHNNHKQKISYMNQVREENSALAEVTFSNIIID